MRTIVNGETIDEELIRNEARYLEPHLRRAMAGASQEAIDERLREWSRENVIELFLLRQAALQDTEPLPAEMAAPSPGSESPAPAAEAGCSLQAGRQMPEAEIQFRIDRLVARHAGRIASPRNKDVVDYYRKHRDELELPERVHAAHIVKKIGETCSEEQAAEAMAAAESELRSGVPFADVADRYSDCPGLGGDLGWFPRGEMVEQFDDVVFSLDSGGVSPVFRTPFGLHIAKVLERMPARPAALEEVRPEIERRLAAEKRQKALERFIDHLRAHAVIEVVP